ncbi:Chromatin assembly factor 1 subunit p90 [Nakaseomyces bracarensis]|uniref:Chromatin assembly factor 1 subunit p90 n=1 Tax=Nakaseomyces bracarensis TaxID=273131 RepID=A0ABR4NW75_9SACH
MTENQKGILSFFQNVPKNKKVISEVIDLEEKEEIITEDRNAESNSKQEKNKDDNSADGDNKDGLKKSKRIRESEEKKEEEKKKKEELRLLEKVQREKKKEEERLKREEERRKKEQQREEERRKKEQQREEEKRKKDQQREEEKKRKEQQREEEKKKREQLRIQKEEEKRQREEERRQKEEEKRKLEEEKRKLEEEKKQKEEAKERAQSRIGNFFRKVTDESSKPEVVKSDYEKFFLPFYARDSVKLNDSWKMTGKELQDSKEMIDSLMRSHHADSELEPVNWLAERRINKRGYPVRLTAISLLQQMTAKEKSDEELQKLLSLVPQKYIKFYENVRPPYVGTYSKEFQLPVDNPFSIEVTGFNYDYDSDLEWVNEEEEDGEEVDNLESGDEDEEEEEDMASEGEFDGFLDTEDGDINSKNNSKKKFVGPLIPIVQLRIDVEKFDAEDKQYFKKVSAVSLSEQHQFPIDPNYISPSASPKKSSLASNDNKRTLGDQDLSEVSTPSGSPDKKAKTLITEATDLLKLFKEVQGSTFSLATITEIVQKNLPQYNKQTVKNTVKEYAIRLTGKTNDDRKWIIKDKDNWDNLQKKIDNEIQTSS